MTQHFFPLTLRFKTCRGFTSTSSQEYMTDRFRPSGLWVQDDVTVSSSACHTSLSSPHIHSSDTRLEKKKKWRAENSYPKIYAILNTTKIDNNFVTLQS